MRWAKISIMAVVMTSLMMVPFNIPAAEAQSVPGTATILGTCGLFIDPLSFAAAPEGVLTTAPPQFITNTGTADCVDVEVESDINPAYPASPPGWVASAPFGPYAAGDFLFDTASTTTWDDPATPVPGPAALTTIPAIIGTIPVGLFISLDWTFTATPGTGYAGGTETVITFTA